MTVTPKTLIESKYAASSEATEYAVPTATTTIIDKFTATNTDTGSQSLTVYIVPNGGAFGGSNKIMSAKSISAGATYDFTELKNQILGAGASIVTVASAASKVVQRASGREVS